jgi:hypothetical protein
MPISVFAVYSTNALMRTSGATMSDTYGYNTVITDEAKQKHFRIVELMSKATEKDLMLLSIACDKAAYTKMTSDKAAAFDLLHSMVGGV